MEEEEEIELTRSHQGIQIKIKRGTRLLRLEDGGLGVRSEKDG